MKSSMEKTSAFFLAAAILVCAGMASCADTKQETNAAVTLAADTGTAAETVTEEETTANERDQYKDVAPAVEDLGGYDFRMGILTANELVFKQVAYDSDEQNGDTLNDAIYQRNLNVEEAYNCKISLVESDEATKNWIQKNVQAGDDFCDIIFAEDIGAIMLRAQAGYLIDLNTLPELNLSQPWWDQRMQSDLSVYGQLYCATGDISIRDELREMSVLYDKALYTEFDYPDPYDYVAGGTWTWDMMSSMVKDVTKDLDGNGKLNCLDQWGLMSENIAGWYLFLASGMNTIAYDGTSYTADIMNEKIYNAFDSILGILVDKNAAIIMDDGKVVNDITTSGIWTEATKMFSEDRVLFRTGTFGDTVDLRAMKKDFGVLPLPKYSEDQDGYYCMCSGDCSPVVIPTTVPDTHKTALITEALAFESKFIVSPKFYEVFLDEKVLRDEKSKEMIDILFASKVYSLDYCSDITGLYSTIYSIVSSGKNNLASKTASIQKAAQKKLDKYMGKFCD